ncbi:MAG: TMEM14 family protein [Verrucomicrobiota bacterium]|nr:TMEM14 family protein [Verrucomicrobiota bacterium]
MIGAAKIYFLIFGVLTIVGGVIGYVNKGSVASIIAGSISGVLLVVAAFLLPGYFLPGIILGGIISLLLAGRFVPAFLKTGGIMPAGMMSVLSVIGVIVAVAALIKR